MRKRAIYPGTFDPITLGHIDIIRRASKLFDELVVAVAENSGKSPLFSLKQRTQMVNKAAGKIKNVTVESFDMVLVDFARKMHAKTIIRGLRAVSDFEYEFQMALMNKELCPEIETLFIMSDASYSFVSSKMLKEIASFNGDLTKFVPSFVAKTIQKTIKSS